MTIRRQKRKAIEQLISGEFETSVVEDNNSENLIAGPSKSPKLSPENLDEIKMFSGRNDV